VKRTFTFELSNMLGTLAVGMSVTRYPPHRSPRAALPHEMCSSTFHAICSLHSYVAPSWQAHWNEQSGGSGHHITTRAKACARTSSVPDHPANAVATCLHR
jgi:hypothetical protein